MNKSNKIFRLIDKFQAMCCLLVAREFVIFTCRKYTAKKGCRSWISYGFANREKDSDVFLIAIRKFCDKRLETKYHKSPTKLDAQEQKQALIDKACKWLDENISDYYTTCEFEQRFDEMFDDFRKAMKGE